MVAVLMGSDSDWPIAAEVVKTLQGFKISCETLVISAHRTPKLAARFASGAEQQGIKIIIAIAGGAAHLAGIVAAHTNLPVIGIPIKSAALAGLDALLSTVQMPAGIPVASMALGKAGAVNAAVLAAQILALQRPELNPCLRAHKLALQKKVRCGNQKIKSQLEKLYD